MRRQLLTAVLMTSALWLATPGDAQDSTRPTRAETGLVLSELEGIWSLTNARGETSFMAFARRAAAIYRGRLAEVDIVQIRRYPDARAEAAGIEAALTNGNELSSISDRLGEWLVDRIAAQQSDDALRERASTEASAAINENVRARLQTLKIMMADAAEHGNGSLTTLNVGFASAPGLVGELDRHTARLAYSGDRLYRVIRGRVWTYNRVSSLSGQAQGDWVSGGRRHWEWQRDIEYLRLYNRCVVYQRSELPVADCRAHRDAMQAFGVIPRPEFVLERFRDFAKPSDAEMTFWRRRMAAMDSWSNTFPALSYCYSSVTSKERVDIFMAKLAASGFADTLWRLALVSNAPMETPRNWTDAEFAQWAPGGDQALSDLTAAVFLRRDGALGFGPNFEGLGFDPRNTWSASENVIVLNFGAEVTVRLPIGGYFNAAGTTNLALAERAFIELVRGNYDVLAKMPNPERHPDFSKLRPLTENQRCEDTPLTTEVTIPTADPKPVVAWPTRAAGSFPVEWHARTDMTDGGTYEDAAAWTEMQAGAFYSLHGADSGRAGKLGVNTKAPTGYAYDDNARWEIRGATLIWHWENFDTFVFELPERYTSELRAAGKNNPQFTLVLTPTDLLLPQARRLPAEQGASEARSLTAPTGSKTQEPDSQAVDTQPAVLGCWRWSNGATIEFDEQGTATNGAATGRWRAGDATRRFNVTWPPVQDTITLASDGRTFDGIGAFGIRFTATKLDAGTGLAGRWRRQDGVVLTFTDDGAATAGSLRGTWSGSARTYRIEWPLIDAIVVSEDGEQLDARNQFGTATGKRQPSC